jgi:hypothetical protein
MEGKRAGMTGINQFNKIIFWRGKVIELFKDVPIGIIISTIKKIRE